MGKVKRICISGPEEARAFLECQGAPDVKRCMRRALKRPARNRFGLKGYASAKDEGKRCITVKRKG